MDLVDVISKEFGIKQEYVRNIIGLIGEGNTIPFIARYRKEATGGIDDQILAGLDKRLEYLKGLMERKAEIIRIIDEQGKLDEMIKEMIERALSLQELEDIYRPFRQKKKTRASVARQKGLEPLALFLLDEKPYVKDIETYANEFTDEEKGVMTVKDALSGAMDIIAEMISDNALFRKIIRENLMRGGIITTKGKTDDMAAYDMYRDYTEPARKIPPHRILAINRANKEGYISMKLETNETADIDHIKSRIIKKTHGKKSVYLEEAASDAYSRLILPSVSNEVSNSLFEAAAEKAIEIFAKNLKQLLMSPPLRGKTVLGLDPAYRTGCKIAVVDKTGKLLDTAVIYPTPPQNRTDEAREAILRLITKHQVDMISIGNGTATKEAEIFIIETIKGLKGKVRHMVVNEAGASVYSASKLASEEFPKLDVSLRSAVSIARRLQDPLAELVKIDPKSLGVGQYQHDMNQKRLGEALTFVVESCVNTVGVDLNTASVSLLTYIAGIGPLLAKNIIEYRNDKGGFKSRNELLKVSKLGPKAYEQSAGFLRVPESRNLLDNTAVHPESYDSALLFLDKLGISYDELLMQKKQIPSDDTLFSKIAMQIGIGYPTLMDIAKELKKPGRDPREDGHKTPEFIAGIISFDDIKEGMILDGVVRNITDFGAFVDIGVHQDGLVHISQMSRRYLKSPLDAVSLGDIVKVRVLKVEPERKRISLSMLIENT